MLIGHASVADVAAALFEVYPQLEQRGYELVPLSALFPPGGEERVANGPGGGGQHGSTASP